ncbi:MAG: hypothetical protein IBX36_01700 [Dehalococcoidia bacterium]|nr:hypothetical protein [Dehalococcoidia bacterium]
MMKNNTELERHDAEIVNAAVQDLAAAYRTLVELLEYYDCMSYFDRMDRLDSMREWLERVLQHLVSKEQVNAWQREAKSHEYSPFGL